MYLPTNIGGANMRLLSAGHSLAPDNEAIKGLTRLRAVWLGCITRGGAPCRLASGWPDALSAFLLSLIRLKLSGTGNW